jgi:hypothetical protein
MLLFSCSGCSRSRVALTTVFRSSQVLDLKFEHDDKYEDIDSATIYPIILIRKKDFVVFKTSTKFY